jgi:hypothetical protein
MLESECPPRQVGMTSADIRRRSLPRPRFYPIVSTE